MTITFDGSLGSTNEKTADTSIVLTVGSSVAVGKLVIVRVATDNQSGSDGASTDISVTDSQGNTYTRIAEETQTGGSANDGVTTGIFYSFITTALTGSTDTITATHNNVVAKGLAAEVFDGDTLTYKGSHSTSGTGTSPSLSMTGESGKNSLFVTACGYENKPTNYTEETGDSWTALAEDGPGTGGPESCVAIAGGYKTTTGGNATHDPTIVSADYAHVGGVFYEDVSAGYTGTLDATIANFTLAAAGELDIDGTLDATIANFTLAGLGEYVEGFVGTLDATIADFTLAAAGSLDIDGALDATIANFTLAAAGELDIDGALDATFANFTLAGLGEYVEGFVGTLDATIADFTLAAAGSLDIDGTLDATIADFTLAAAGELDIVGTLDATIADFTLAGSGTLVAPITGTLDVTIADFTLAAAGSLDIAGTLDATFANFTLNAAGALAITGTLDVTFDNFTLSTLTATPWQYDPLDNFQPWGVWMWGHRESYGWLLSRIVMLSWGRRSRPLTFLKLDTPSQKFDKKRQQVFYRKD